MYHARSSLPPEKNVPSFLLFLLITSFFSTKSIHIPNIYPNTVDNAMHTKKTALVPKNEEKDT